MMLVTKQKLSWYVKLAILAQMLCGSGIFADDKSDTDFFENRIRPLLIDHCEACHSAAKGKTSGGLALDTRDGWSRGGDSGRVIIPGKAEESLLIRAVKRLEDVSPMPPKDKGDQLTATQIADLTQWIARGAIDPRVSAPKLGGMTVEEARNWWAFQPLQQPLLPEVRDPTWPANDIDRFILAQQDARGLRPVAPADKRTLIRRATFDLTGLPPTPGEIDAFLADDSSEAFVRLIDRLLSSSSYGERWGRHWLDVARYADTAGDGADYPVREARLYRDWVIQAFNNDQPYDEFLREQIAGDIIAKSGPPELLASRVTATGFLAIGKRYGYNTSPDFQHLDFADAIDSVGRSVLGLSLGCARCHDHKYDPVTMSDYYALYGILLSTQWAFPGGEEQKRPVNFAPLVQPEEAAKLDKIKAVELAAIDAEIAKLKAELAKEENKTNKDLNASLEADIKTRTKTRDQRASQTPYPVAYGLSEGTPVNARVQLRGEPDKLGDEVPRRFIEILGGDPLPTTSSGSGRLELADWLTRPTSALTARVFVNRVWQWHFGIGLVPTASDFGLRGQAPTHPELLDWLTSQFVNSGWRVKSLHRLIMTSRTYQLSSDDDEHGLKIDPGNRWLWRTSRRPLDAESIRDAMLFVSGRLDTSPAPIHPFPPVDTWGFSIHAPFQAVYDTNHRSIYLMVQRNRRHPFLSLFDAADPNQSVAERMPTTTPTQSLYLMNSAFVHEQSEAFAASILQTEQDAALRVQYAFQAAHGRLPSQADQAEALAFINAYENSLSKQSLSTKQRTINAWSALARVLLTSNAFLYVD